MPHPPNKTLQESMNNPLPPLPIPQQSPGQQPPTTSNVPLHPEIRSAVSLNTAHTQKIYFSGPLVHIFGRDPDGHKPHKDEGCRDVWAQLYGTTLAIWDTAEVKIATRQGKEIPPSYANIVDAVRSPFLLYHLRDLPHLHLQFVIVLGSLIQPATQTSSPRKYYTKVFALNTAGANALIFSCSSDRDLISWVTAFRLSYWEKSRLEEIYSAHLIRTTLNDGKNIPSTLTNGRLEGWVRVRIAGQTDWKRLWMCLSAGSIMSATRSSTDVASTGSRSSLSGRNPRHSSYITPKKHGISDLFSRDRSSVLPERANISLYISPQGKVKREPFLTFDAVTQAFAVYPGRQDLIGSSTLVKLEGTYGDEDICGKMKGREAWMLLMPDLEGAESASGEVVKWLIGEHTPCPGLL